MHCVLQHYVCLYHAETLCWTCIPAVLLSVELTCRPMSPSQTLWTLSLRSHWRDQMMVCVVQLNPSLIQQTVSSFMIESSLLSIPVCFTHSHDLYWLYQTDPFQKAPHPLQLLLLSEIINIFIVDEMRWDKGRLEVYLVNGKLYSCVFILCDLLSTSNLLPHPALRGLKHTWLI